MAIKTRLAFGCDSITLTLAESRVPSHEGAHCGVGHVCWEFNVFLSQ